MIKLTQEHLDAGLSLGYGDPDILVLYLNGTLADIWYRRDVTLEAVKWAADKYLNKVYEKV